MKQVYTRNRINLVKKRESEAWIYSYADLVTNLMALFVMLFIITTGPQKAKLDFIKGFEDYYADKTYASGRIGTGRSEIDDLKQIITETIQKSRLGAQVSLSATPTGIELTFESALVFASGTAEINDEAREILSEVSSLAKKLPARYIIIVEGHSDSRPVTSGQYPSNWELSSARAGGVVRFFQSLGVAAKRMRAVGYADSQPLEQQADSAKNRRVVIKIDSEESWKSK